MTSINWNPSAKFCASSAHMGWAAALFLGAIDHSLSMWWVAPCFMAFALLKEFWADLTWLEQDSIQGSTLDFVTYVLGMGIGLLGGYRLWLGMTAGIVALLVAAVIDYGKLSNYWPYD